MTTPQDSPRKKKKKARRTKQLEQWRAKKAAQTEPQAETKS